MQRLATGNSRLKGFVLLSLFLLMGISLGVHTLSPHHLEHILSHVSHPGHADDPDGNYIPTGDPCAVDLFAHTAYDTPIVYDIPEAPRGSSAVLITLPATPVLRHPGCRFLLRAPPASLYSAES